MTALPYVDFLAAKAQLATASGLWTEQCKDGSRMGAGMPEYILLFRKPPTDASNGYADVPVVKSKDAYSRTRWQIDAHGFARSNGDRPLTPEDLVDLPHERIFKLFRDHGLGSIYDFEEHVRLGEQLEAKGRLPTTFMLLQPPSWHPDVWTDVARMRTLNMNQERKGQQMHLCPLQFDIVDRLIVQFSMPGETVFDPFAGLMTVPYCAVKLGRRGVGVELNPTYFRDGIAYVEAAASQASVPTLLDLLDDGAEEAAAVPAEPTCTGCGRTEADSPGFRAYAAGPYCLACCTAALTAEAR